MFGARRNTHETGPATSLRSPITIPDLDDLSLTMVGRSLRKRAKCAESDSQKDWWFNAGKAKTVVKLAAGYKSYTIFSWRFKFLIRIQVSKVSILVFPHPTRHRNQLSSRFRSTDHVRCLVLQSQTRTLYRSTCTVQILHSTTRKSVHISRSDSRNPVVFISTSATVYQDTKDIPSTRFSNWIIVSVTYCTTSSATQNTRSYLTRTNSISSVLQAVSFGTTAV